MGTKLSAIIRVIKSSNYTLITVGREGVRTTSHGKEDLEAALLVATTLLATHQHLMEQITAQATEAGELHTLQAIRNVIAEMETNGGK